MITATIDGDSIDIEEQIENPEPRHLLRLREEQLICVHTDNHEFIGAVSEEGKLEVGSDREIGITVTVYIPAKVGESQYAYLTYCNDSLGESMVVHILGAGDGRDALQSIKVISDE